VEKIKTIGDGYLAVAGATKPRADHVAAMCELSLRMQEAMPVINRELGTAFKLRVGIHTGRLVAGVVGTSRFAYDLWGETVNLASRMESTTNPGAIQVTEAVADAGAARFDFERHGTTEVKGVGPVATCLLVGRKAEVSPGLV
jgi:class 3 adenylate cyclase